MCGGGRGCVVTHVFALHDGVEVGSRGHKAGHEEVLGGGACGSDSQSVGQSIK